MTGIPPQHLGLSCSRVSFCVQRRSICFVPQVLTVLGMERGALPLCVGVWLDVCCLVVLGGSRRERLAVVLANPVPAAGIHWFLGVAYMLYVSSLVSIVQNKIVPIALPRALSWLHMPAGWLPLPADPRPCWSEDAAVLPGDDQADFLRALVDERPIRQLLRLGLALIMYVTSLVLIVHFPVQATSRLFPGFFPLRQRLASPSSGAAQTSVQNLPLWA